ncbi:MAG: EAL domain-containing protein [Gammaproteobacteria bacterium]|nr:EAL domain-containing protein [Gammaproteobacteria bacterium]
MESNIASLWLILATFLVLSMQAGFLMLEGGRVRSKNSINVAQKNITDLVVVWVVFFGAGFSLMFGVSVADLVSEEGVAGTATPMHFIYQMAFCSTAATIVSGAVAERMSFRAYLALVAVIGVFIYPVVGRAVWGDTYQLGVTAWLGSFGFIDFAGSTVVHGVGAWIGLVCILIIGPRIGRFDENGEPQVMPAHNAVIALFGVFVLMLGWLGFNGGTISPEEPMLYAILFNTLTAGVFGGAAGMVLGCYWDKGVFNPSRVTSGLLGGLVACTASVHFLNAYESMFVGIAGGLIATWGAYFLLHKLKLDDPLDVVATHGFAGVFGTLAVPFVAPASAFQSGSRLIQLGVQSAGVLGVFAFVCAVTWLSLKLIGRFTEVRVSAEAEEIGLNYTEHGESIGLSRLQNTLSKKIDSASSFKDAIVVDVDDEHSELAATLNKVIEKYELANEEISRAQTRFQQFAETASDWLWETDANMHINFFHANTEHADKLIANDVMGMSFLDMLILPSQDIQFLQMCIEARESTPVFEAMITSREDQAQPFAVEVRGVPNLNTAGEFIGYRGTVTDISVRKAAEEKALFLSMHDELTGLPNRRALSRDLKVNIDRAANKGEAVVIAGVDLDGFKGINDAYGHLAGDDLLIQVASRLESFLRPEDTAYRTGGDEFVVVLDTLSQDKAIHVGRAITERLVKVLSEDYSVKTMTVSIGASVGITAFPHHGDDTEDLLRMADLALYAAKDAGKGRVVNFQAEHDRDAKLQLRLESDLRKAIEEEEFYLMYQPQVDALSERVCGYEALIRWKHPERGDISPADFISVAEKLNLMDQIGGFVLDKACEFASTWQPDETESIPKISVNVSPQQFKNPGFISTVVEALDKHQLSADRLELEITEDVLVHDFIEVSSLLTELKTLGVSVAVDDFGSGQTSLRYLNNFPLSTLKIDRSFIKHLTSDPKAAEITRTIVHLGQKLGVKVLAEGVEEIDQLNLLREWNCDQIQGFFFSKPLMDDVVTVDINDAASEPFIKKSA